MKKKILLTLLIVSVLVCIFAVSISAANPVYEYDTSRTAKLDNGTVVPLYDENDNALSYYNNGTEIVSDLTTNIFKWNSSGWLEMKDASVIPAANVVVINLQDPTMDETAFSNYGINLSFKNSTNLEYVYFSNVIKKFNGSYYFSNCDKMKVFEITADSMLESFGQYTFYDCAVLGALYIPSGVKEIPTGNSTTIGFASQCPCLSSVTFAENSIVTSIGQTAFYKTAITQIDLPDSLTSISSNAFYLCTSLVDINIPDAVVTVGSNAIRETAIVNSPFTANSQCETIGQHAFYKCESLVEINIPSKLTETPNAGDGGLFYGCKALKKVNISEDSVLTSIGYGCFDSCSALEEIVLPQSLTSIGENAFRGCTSLQNILIPDSVLTVNNNAFRETGIINSPFSAGSNCTFIGYYAFYNCTALEEINIPAHASYACTISKGGGTFQGCSSLFTVNFKDDMDDVDFPHYMFSGCTSLETIELPNSVTELPARMFNSCSKLTTIKLGAKVTTLNNFRDLSDGHNSFTFGCNNLKYVYIPKTLSGEETTCYAFNSGSNITFYFNGDAEQAEALKASFNPSSASCVNNGKLTGAEIITLENYKQLSEIKKNYIVINCNTCEFFYDNIHDVKTEGDNKCSGICANCGLTKILENPEHTSNWIFNNGGSVSLVAQITAEHTCVYCQTVEETKTIDAIFTSTGYSYEMNGNEYTGIYQRTSVDKEALALYAELTGNKDSYNFGIVAGLAADANDNPIDGNLITATNGEANLANETTVIGTFLNTEYTIMEIKVTGVTSASQLYCGAFIVTGNDVTYLCGTAQNNVATKATFPQ